MVLRRRRSVFIHINEYGTRKSVYAVEATRSSVNEPVRGLFIHASLPPARLEFAVAIFVAPRVRYTSRNHRFYDAETATKLFTAGLAFLRDVIKKESAEDLCARQSSIIERIYPAEIDLLSLTSVIR